MSSLKCLLKLVLGGLILILMSVSTWADTKPKGRIAKDVGPAHLTCDQEPKGSERWKNCLGKARSDMSDEELFYAGYWLAKTGHYGNALSYLNLARRKDERILTYIGYATRKLGDVKKALPLYGQALDLNPNYVVARAYLGEAYLMQGQLTLAQAQLHEIQTRCGVSCPSYRDLEQQISEYVSAHG